MTEARGVAELSPEELDLELGIETAPIAAARPASEERIIAGFEEIQRFVAEHGRAPRHGEGLDIFERLYAVRLDRLRALPDARAILMPLDHQALLSESMGAGKDVAELDDDELLAELAIELPEDDVRVLRNVTARADRDSPEEVAVRKPCADFEEFRPIFEQAENDLAAGLRTARPFAAEDTRKTAKGDLFILSGLFAYVAEAGDRVKAPNGQWDARLRVIYSNGTESNILGWSLQRALYKDETARRVSDPAERTLFESEWEGGDESSGTIYVARSLSDHPYIAAHRAVVHKIGVTGGSVEERVRGASDDPTFLFAPAEIVATYKLAGVNRAKLEALLHRVFARSRMAIEIPDRFGRPYRPQEWFVAPLPAIAEAVARVRDGTLAAVEYDPSETRFVPTK